MNVLTKTLITVLVIVALSVVAVVTQTAFTAQGAAPSGLPAVVGTSTTQHLVAATPTLVFPTSTNCAARVITTASSSIQISFSDKQSLVPGVTAGHMQAGSTTVAYDSGLYGCDAVRIYSWTAQKITIQESR
jgi:hypothetical protein